MERPTKRACSDTVTCRRDRMSGPSDCRFTLHSKLGYEDGASSARSGLEGRVSRARFYVGQKVGQKHATSCYFPIIPIHRGRLKPRVNRTFRSILLHLQSEWGSGGRGLFNRWMSVALFGVSPVTLGRAPPSPSSSAPRWPV